VSVATACYNSESFIERTFQSVLDQNYENLEWNVVVDGLTDATLAILESCKLRSPFTINLIVFERNRGGPIAVLTAVQACTGDFSIILDHDDELMPNAIHRLLEAWSSTAVQTGDMSNISGVFGRCVDENGDLLGPRIPPLGIATLGHFVYEKGCTAECACLFRTVILKRFYQFTANELGSTSGLIWNRMSRHYRWVFTDLVVRRYHTNVASSLSNNRKIRTPGVLANQELELLNDNARYLLVNPRLFLKKIALYQRYSIHDKRSFVRSLAALSATRLRAAAICMYPVARYLVFADQRGGRVAD